MQPNGSVRAQIGTLIVATSAIQLANGFFGTFISLRIGSEDFSATMAGLVLSSYFAGLTLGALRCGRIIERIGHIRAYAAFAGMVVAATAAMPLLAGSLVLAGAARGHRVRLLRDLRHHRELAECQGAAVRTRAGIFGLHGRHVRGPRTRTTADRPDRHRFSRTVQRHSGAFRHPAGHGEHKPGRAAADNHFGQASLTANCCARRLSQSPAVRSAGSSAARSTPWFPRGCRTRASGARQSRCSCWWRCWADLRSRSLSAGFRIVSIGVWCWPGRSRLRGQRDCSGCFCRGPCRRCCRPRRCWAASCQPSTRSASPTRMIRCRGGPGRRGKRPAYSGERLRLGGWPAHRHEHHGVFHDRRRAVFHGCRGNTSGSAGRGAACDHGSRSALAAVVPDSGTASGAPRARPARRLRRTAAAGGRRDTTR